MALACGLCGSEWGGFRKRDNGPLFCLGEGCPPAFILIPDTSLSSGMPQVPFKLLPQCWTTEGMSD